MLINRWRVLLAAMLLWTVIYLTPAHTAGAPLIWLAMKGFFAFLLPGWLMARLIYAGDNIGIAQTLNLGFLLSIAILSGLGLVGLVLGLPAIAVHGSIAVLSLGLLLYASLYTEADTFTWRWLRIGWMQASGLLSGLLLLLFSLLISDFTADAQTYNAFTYEFVHSPALSFQEPILNSEALPTSRLWLALWPMALANMIFFSGAELLNVYPYFAPFLVFVLMTSVYGLARRFGFRPQLAALAVVLQIVAVFGFGVEYSFMSFGLLFGDKYIAALILFNIVFWMLLRYETHTDWRNYTMYFIGVIVLPLVHSTVTVLIGAAVGLYMLMTKQCLRSMLRLLMPFGVAALILSGLRLADGSGYAVSAQLPTNDREWWAELVMGRVNVIEGTLFVGMSPALADDARYYLLAMVACVALWRVLRRKAERVEMFLLAMCTLLVFILIPYTGWLLGVAITPYHLYRVRFILPFGIAAAYLLRFIVENFDIQFRRDMFVVGVATLGISFFVIGTVLPAWDEVQAEFTVLARGQDIHVRWYTDELLMLSETIEAQANGMDQRVLTYPIWTMNFAPSASLKMTPFLFRAPVIFARHAGLPSEEARVRYALYAEMFAEDVDAKTFADLFARSEVDYLIVPKSWWIGDDYQTKYREIFQIVAETDFLVLMVLDRQS